MVGVLALQGDFAEHLAALRALGAEAREVRRPADLAGLEGLVLPGGESTTLLRHFREADWLRALREFGAGHGLLGTCAGAILLASAVENPPQECLGLLPATVRRNAFGRQLDSTTAVLTDHALGGGPLPAVFIRAPSFRALGPGVEVLARRDGEPVLVRYGRVLAASFHPELGADGRVHRLFLDACRG